MCAGGQGESAPPTPTTDRQCAACEAGVSFQAQEIHTDTCEPVRTCGPGEGATANPTLTSDRQCEACTLGQTFQGLAEHADPCAPVARCPAGTFEMVAPTLTSDRQCAPCDGDTYMDLEDHAEPTCKSTTVCAPAQAYMTREYTPTSDRECAPLTNCGNRAVTTPHTPTSDRACARCVPGERFDEPNCVACGRGHVSLEHHAATCEPCDAGSFQPNEVDSKCRQCPAGSFQSQRGQSACEECPDGFVCAEGQVQPEPCNGTQLEFCPAGASSRAVCDCTLDNTAACNASTGECMCQPGFSGVRCAQSAGDSGISTPMLAAVAAAAALLLLLLVVVLMRRRRRARVSVDFDPAKLHGYSSQPPSMQLAAPRLHPPQPPSYQYFGVLTQGTPQYEAPAEGTSAYQVPFEGGDAAASGYQSNYTVLNTSHQVYHAVTAGDVDYQVPVAQPPGEYLTAAFTDGQASYAVPLERAEPVYEAPPTTGPPGGYAYHASMGGSDHAYEAPPAGASATATDYEYEPNDDPYETPAGVAAPTADDDDDETQPVHSYDKLTRDAPSPDYEAERPYNVFDEPAARDYMQIEDDDETA